MSEVHLDSEQDASSDSYFHPRIESRRSHSVISGNHKFEQWVTVFFLSREKEQVKKPLEPTQQELVSKTMCEYTATVVGDMIRQSCMKDHQKSHRAIGQSKQMSVIAWPIEQQRRLHLINSCFNFTLHPPKLSRQKNFSSIKKKIQRHTNAQRICTVSKETLTSPSSWSSTT